MKKLIILTIAIILSGTVSSRSKTTTVHANATDFSASSYSVKNVLATAD
ncbi:hypothetical protein ACFQZS_05055 [Mucilaginibacter calamicampi]|uniref:Uncharacterized protein n=1 Tax=Mucilaginibacter calamicampi TaxID=1302352 RepID=A0ABW2YUF1_9SPHI